jgi:hypothetical protein
MTVETDPSDKQLVRKGKFSFLDLSDKFNDSLDGGLPATGKQLLGDVEFLIADRYVQLGNTDSVYRDRPERAEAISIKKKCAKLHFLHSSVNGDPKDKSFDGVVIGEYRIQYADESVQKIPIVYGQDLQNCYSPENYKDPTQARVVWKGENKDTKPWNGRVRLYLMSWENPKPDLMISRIDFLSRKKEISASPLCVAITVEE